MHTDVAIVGGGLSGLSLARGLEMAGRDYRLIEARSRLGGRILSTESRNSLTWTDRYDLGPAWIWPHQRRIARLVDQFDLRVFDQYSSGKLVLQESDGSVRRDLNFSIMGDSQRIAGGVGRIIEELTKSLPSDRILTQHAVTSIRQAVANGEADVHLDGLSGDGTFEMAADTVVLALPPRVVAQSVDFTPPLNPKHVAAMDAIPTWMAGHAKVIAVYERPFWRELGLSGDGISHRGPLAEIHDATPLSENEGALFGFVGIPTDSKDRNHDQLVSLTIEQLTAMYGSGAAKPLDVLVLDWAKEALTATYADRTGQSHHSPYRTPQVLENLWNGRLILASSEIAPINGGFLEGALEASEIALAKLVSGNTNQIRSRRRK